MNDCLHHALANIVRTVHIIEVVIMLVFDEVESKAFEDFKLHGYDFGILALA